jgi:antitoxin component of RelBE/YafQ-DinJ toxin-antitoxin module
MKPIEELHLNRCNVQIEDDVKAWYMYKAKSMGMSMSQLMSFVLSNWYESHINADAVRMIAELNQSEDLKQTNQGVFELIAEMRKFKEDEGENG